MSQHHVILLLGSNLGDKEKNIETAFVKLQENGCKIINRSKVLITSPVEFVSKNNFCNIATSISTEKSPTKLLLLIKNIEEEIGRIKDTKAVGKLIDRLIDIDIVEFNNIEFYSKKLIIPHQKHILEREFSKVLLMDLEDKTEKHTV